MGTWGVVPSLAHVTRVAACPTCYSLDQARRRPEEFLARNPDLGGSFWIFPVALKDARLAAEAGCQFCAVLCSIFRHILTTESQAIDSPEANVTVVVPVSREWIRRFHVTFNYPIAQADSNCVQVVAKEYYLATVGKCTNTVELTSDDTDHDVGHEGPLGNLGAGGYVSANPLSEICLRKILSWLQDCLSAHSSVDCSYRRLSTPGFVPTRLISVGTGAAMPKIIESLGNIVHYTALTYCWGNAKIPLSTTANLLERLHCLRWDLLPPVFKDAIVLTRALGIKYIWIDAICILQDDPEDVSKELSQMIQIYHEALLVISADSATSANDRLFKERPGSVCLRTKSTISSTQGPEILLHRGINHSLLNAEDASGFRWPLATRGWTLQERFLATRLIHISDAEVVWECSEKLRCECKYMDQAGRNQKGRDRAMLVASSLRLRFVNHLDADTSDGQKAECWYDIVREYSGRLCSVDVDRLPAISGLARRFGTVGIGEYCAGIWTNYALRMISWHRTPGKTCRRPSQYTAPSWSWASIIGQIDWEFSKDWDFGNLIPHGDHFIAQVIDIGCHTTNDDPFGRVSSGHLTLSSPTLMVATRDPEEGSRELDLEVDYTLILDVNSPKEYGELPKNGVVMCLFLEDLDDGDMSALVLKQCSSGFGKYQRVGKLFVYNKEKLPELATKAVTIC